MLSFINPHSTKNIKAKHWAVFVGAGASPMHEMVTPNKFRIQLMGAN